MTTHISLFSPSGVVAQPQVLRLAQQRLQGLGYGVELDASALKKSQRFAGDESTRVAAIHRVATGPAEIAMASRGGYGLTRILDALDFKKIAKAQKLWVGHSDFTAFHLAMLAHTGQITFAGPMACADFGAAEVDEITQDVFLEAMRGELEAVGFTLPKAEQVLYSGLDVKGVLWGGNLAMLCSLLGTPHMPRIKGGILFLEDVNEHPYRIERMLLQLQQAGVLSQQKAVVLGAFTEYKPSPLDRGYTFKAMVNHVRSLSQTPILTGLPFGHVPTKVTLPVGAKTQLVVAGKDTLLAWGHV
jgi:muramoyltetrapeptide carboxypeptidase